MTRQIHVQPRRCRLRAALLLGLCAAASPGLQAQAPAPSPGQAQAKAPAAASVGDVFANYVDLGALGQPAAAPAATAAATLATAPAQVAANAQQLATVFPAEQRARMAQAYQQSFEAYQKLEARLGVPANDVAGAVAAFIAGNYMALRNVDLPDPHYQRLVAQMRQALQASGGFMNAGAAQKRQMYEQLAMVGTFMAVARQSFAQNPNPGAEANFRNAARANLEQALQRPAERLQIGPGGLSLQ
jgi:hypothetical protein